MALPSSLDVSKVQQLRERFEAGETPDAAEILSATTEHFDNKPLDSFLPLLGMLSLQGKPYSLKNHFPFEPAFKMALPKRILLKCGRQVSKSTSISANGVLRCAGLSHLRMLFVTPRYEQIRRLSTNYIRPFISQSLIRPLLTDEGVTQGVLQRSFANQSTMFFSFAFLDCERIRGIACDFIDFDEVQDIDWDFIPIINECMSASMMGISMYSGTPKTLDNTVEALWQESSKAEWVTPCMACGHWNMASIHEDLRKMIGRSTVICAKCQRPIQPRLGHWYHTDPQRGQGFLAYHVPQVIMPMHYENEDKWRELLAKRDGKGGYNSQKFLNEVLGESADVGINLVTMTDIKKASKLNVNTLEAGIDGFRRCKVRVIGVDWGGGGEDEVSFTTVALLGLDVADGKYKVFYCERFHSAYTHDEEAARIIELFREGACHFMCHDYGGSGGVRETLIVQAGLPIEKILNFSYVRATTRNIVFYKPPFKGEMRGYWQLDKARALVVMATCVKAGFVQLPEYESSKDVTHDLLNLMEDKHEMPKGADMFLIRRRPKTTDDFAHSLTFGLFGIFHTEQRYPDLSEAKRIKLSEEQLSLASPPNPISMQ